MRLGNNSVQHHYVIRFDVDTKTWLWDVETEEIAFPDGTLYDTEIERWVFPYIFDRDELMPNVHEITEQLKKFLALMTEDARKETTDE